MKLGGFEQVKGRQDAAASRRGFEEGATVAETCALPMDSLLGAKRAARAMLVASVFAAELSEREGVPVVVVGRPPGHHPPSPGTRPRHRRTKPPAAGC